MPGKLRCFRSGSQTRRAPNRHAGSMVKMRTAAWRQRAPGRAKQARGFALRATHAARSSLIPRRRNAFDTTDTDDRLIASAAIIGDSTMPNTGYSTPAAIGTPIAL